MVTEHINPCHDGSTRQVECGHIGGSNLLILVGRVQGRAHKGWIKIFLAESVVGIF